MLDHSRGHRNRRDGLQCNALGNLDEPVIHNKDEAVSDLACRQGPKILINISFPGSDDGNSVKGVVCLCRSSRFCAHAVHSIIVPWISDIMDGQ